MESEKDLEEVKSFRICVRLQPDLYKYIKKLQENTGKSESEVVRSILYAVKNNKKVEMVSTQSLIQQKQLINEINFIGRNINQIVKNNNSGLYSTQDKNKLFALMNKIVEMVANNGE